MTSAAELRRALEARGVRFELGAAGELRVNARRGELTDSDRTALAEQREALLDLFRREAVVAALAPLTPAPTVEEAREPSPLPDAVPAPAEGSALLAGGAVEAAPASPALEAGEGMSATETLLERARVAGWPAFDLLGWGPIGGSESLWRRFVDRAATEERWLKRAAAALALWAETRPETKWAERRFREVQKAIPIAWGAKPEGAVGWKNELPRPAPDARDRWRIPMLSPDGEALLEAGESLQWPRLSLVEPFRFIPPGEYPWQCWIARAGQDLIAYALECARGARNRDRRDT